MTWKLNAGDRSDMKLDGATVLVTGGAIRFGAYLCRAFARRGAKLIIHYRNSYAEANALLQELGGGHQTVYCDLQDTAQAENMIRTFAPDVLINNAASYDRAPLPEETAESAAAQYAVNALTPIAMLRTLSEVRKGRETAAVNILDCAISAVPSASFSYILSKKMLASATKLAARQCAPDLRVNAVAPGNMIPVKELAHLNMQGTAARLPLKRPVDPEDVAESAVFLAENSSITGTVLFTDCGQSLLEEGE